MKVLFISNKNFITRSDSGGAQCSRRNYNMVEKAFGKKNTHLLVFSDEDINSTKENINIIKFSTRNICKYINMFFLRDCYSKKDEMLIKECIEKINPKLVFFDGSSFGYIAKYLSNESKKIAFYHNIEKRYAQSRILRTSPICIIKYFSFWLNERYLTRRADLKICLNDRDNKLLFETYGEKADYCFPISFEDVVDESRINDELIETNTLLFIGSYFMPNIQGIKWFCKKVMPYVNKKLLIVGKNMERLREQLECENVEIIGTVENLEEYYAKAEAIVMPIMIGDGMKVKTAEAMMYGKIIFATDEALEGYEVTSTHNIYRCNTAEEFITSINTVKEYGFCKEVRQLFQNKYSNNIIEDKFISILRGYE